MNVNGDRTDLGAFAATVRAGLRDSGVMDDATAHKLILDVSEKIVARSMGEAVRALPDGVPDGIVDALSAQALVAALDALHVVMPVLTDVAAERDRARDTAARLWDELEAATS